MLLSQAIAGGSSLLKRKCRERMENPQEVLDLLMTKVKKRRKEMLAICLIIPLLLGAVYPLLTSHGSGVTEATILGEGAPTTPSYVPSQSEGFTLGKPSANLTVQRTGTIITVFTEEYMIKVDYTTHFVDYTIHPYFTSDFIRYRRVNPQYSGEGTIDQNGNNLNVLSMTISRYGRSGNTVWFVESCPEFSLNQTFVIYRDYFELNVNYKPGTKKVLTTYFIGLYDKSNTRLSLLTGGKFGRYVPGYPEDNKPTYGMGGWYPRTGFYAPACDLRAPNHNIGVEWGYNETVAYLYSPIWMKDMGGGGPSNFALKFSSINSVVPNIALGTQETFHMFVRPYKYSDGAEHGYDVGYAQWVAPRIASYWGNHDTPVFPLAIMDTGSWSTTFRNWVENSQVKLATYSNNPDQIDWNYKSVGRPYRTTNTPSAVPVAWQIYKAPGTPLTDAQGNAKCNPVNGPYSTSGTYRWQLIQNDPSPAWWWGSEGVFWDGMDPIDNYNKPRNDYQNRNEFIYDGYLRLVADSYTSRHWEYVIANGWSATLHLSIVADISIVENFEPSSACGDNFTAHVASTMKFVNNIPAQYRPNILVYQKYDATDNWKDQNDVYSILFNAAKYGFNVELQSWSSYSSQMHNNIMAEEMFKAMGCTRNSDTRIGVATLDLLTSQSLTTAEKMIVTRGAGHPKITSTADRGGYIFTNLNGGAVSFDLSIPTSYYYYAGTNTRTASPITYTPDGKATFHGTVDAEKTGRISKNSNVQITQQTTGTAKVSLISIGNGQAQLTIGATGGTTSIKLKGFTAGNSYDIIVNSVVVAQKTAASDGSVSFARSFGNSDKVQVKASPSTPKSTTGAITQPTLPASAVISDPNVLALLQEMNSTMVQRDTSPQTQATEQAASIGILTAATKPFYPSFSPQS